MRILLVEDDDQVRQDMAGFLGSHGHYVRAFANAEAAIAHVYDAGGRYDWMIVDVDLGGGMTSMPGRAINGFRFLEVLQANGLIFGARILVLDEPSHYELSRRIRAEGQFGAVFLLKPLGSLRDTLLPILTPPTK